MAVIKKFKIETHKGDETIVELKNISRIWAIGSIHSNLNSFNSIKDFILKNTKEIAIFPPVTGG